VEEFTCLTALSSGNVCYRIHKIHEDGYTMKNAK